jgi:hypothetical protein
VMVLGLLHMQGIDFWRLERRICGDLRPFPDVDAEVQQRTAVRMDELVLASKSKSFDYRVSMV